MATTSTLDSAAADAPREASATAPDLLLWLAALPAEAAQSAIFAAENAFPDRVIAIATHEPQPAALPANVRWITPQTAATGAGWVPVAGDYADAAHAARQCQAACTLVVGAHYDWLSADALRSLDEAQRTRQVDLLLPAPPARGDEGLVNAGLLFPLTRALFGVEAHYPLPTDAVLSQRMLDRLATAAKRSAPAHDALLWPVSEAAIAGFSVRELRLDDYRLPRPPEGAFSDLFSAVAGSLFADIELKASFWQRARTTTAAAPAAQVTTSTQEASDEVRTLVDNFRLAYSNLHDIWSLLLPPQSLLALKRLSMMPPESFTLAPSLWARIVYDFALGYRLRTINRGHLLGALTPLYLAWVASHVRAAGANPDQGARIAQETALAFETEKSYIVSRWRWPDRFNP